MNRQTFLFWQPQIDYLRLLSNSRPCRITLVILNYLIWIFLFFISYLLVKNNPNTFWQILLATILSEIIEKVLKQKKFWRRPMFVHHDQTPPGLVKNWYQTGSFPSGHTIKATYFLLLIIQYHVFSPLAFIAITGPLLFFRILVGFHYPIDLLGGLGFGSLMWFIVSQISFPPFVNQLIEKIFNIIFFIH